MQVRPIHYELEFEPVFSNFTFIGREKIDIRISRPTNVIILNATELQIKKCLKQMLENIQKNILYNN